MSEQIRGLVAALSVASVLIGTVMCDWESIDGIIRVCIGFFFASGLVLRFGSSQKDGKWLALAMLIPPFFSLLYVRIAFSLFGCTKITGHPPDLVFLAQIYLCLVVVEWLGIVGSDSCRQLASWAGSRAFLRLLDKISLRLKRIGQIVNQLSGLGKLAKLFSHP